MTWDPTLVKVQLRSTTQLLGHLQAKKDANSVTRRKEIGVLLGQGNIALARSKAHDLIQEEAQADLLEVLEQQVGTLLDHIAELEQQRSPPSSPLLEALSSIIYAAPHTQLRELNVITDMIAERLGDEMANSARHNKHNNVSSKVLKVTSRPALSSSQLDAYLESIAKSYGVSWIAGPRRRDLVKPLAELLDPTTTPEIDIAQLRRLCSQGVPDEPGWLRPRIWKLLMNIFPTNRTVWKRENTKQRNAYYDLVRRLLRPFPELPPPTNPISAPDVTLIGVFNHLTRIPVDLLNRLDSEPAGLEICPLSPNSSESIRIPLANCLDSRLQLLLRLSEANPKGVLANCTPEIRLEADLDAMPTTSLAERSNAPTTLLSSRTITLGNASQSHVSALLRLLYIHASINPGNLSPYVPSLLVPLYTTLLQEVEREDLAHAEADAFWLFEAFVAEFAELEEDEGLSTWMTRFGDQLEQKDPKLSEQLSMIGLHPSSPHFSPRWLSSMLTHTLSLPAIFPIWDVVLSCQGRERDKHPRLDSMIEICTAMMIAVKPLIFKQVEAPGPCDKDSPSLLAQPGEGFLEGLAVLQAYPLDSLGGIDNIIQLMGDLNRPQRPLFVGGPERKTQLGLGARIRTTMWKGFTNQITSPDQSDEEESSNQIEEGRESGIDDGNETETPSNKVLGQPVGLTSRIANTVWRGITNQSSMDTPPSPVLTFTPDTSLPTVPSMERLSSPESLSDNPSSASTSLWSYTEKLKDSDTMATLAKLSTNWRAKAMLSPWSRPKSPALVPTSLPQETRSALTSPVQRNIDSDLKRSSLPLYDHTGAPYTPPPRPSFFRNPRDSIIPLGAVSGNFSPDSVQDDLAPREKSNGGFLDKTRSLQSSLLSLARTPSPIPPLPPMPKSGPRPLMLNSTSLMTARKPRAAPSIRDSVGEDWADAMKLRKSQLHRDSVSSASSLSPSDAFYRMATHSEYESDGSTSRIVPLNRRSVSPMALASKMHHSRPPSTTSSVSSDHTVPETPAKEGMADGQNDIEVSSPKEEDDTPNGKAEMAILSDTASLTRKSYRRKPQAILPVPGDTSDSSIGDTASRAAHLRSKRYPPRLSNLQIDNTAQFVDTKSPSPSNLTVPWPHEEHDTATTPRATSFDSDAIPSSPSKSPKIKEERPRKISGTTRHRKLSSSNRESVRRSRSDSTAEDGDDEGYDDLLSAYESEGSLSLT